MERLLSLTIAVLTFIVTFLTREWEISFPLLILLILAIACIWYGEDFVEAKAITTTARTHGAFVRYMGWVLLIMPIIFFLVEWLKKVL